MVKEDLVPQLLFVVFLMILIVVFFVKRSAKEVLVDQPKVFVAPEEIKSPETPKISVKIPPFLKYPELKAQLSKWESEAGDLVDIIDYGKSTKGKDLIAVRLTNEFKKEPKKVILITASIHGNEPWSTGCVMGYIGDMLSNYGVHESKTNILDTTELYFIPVVSPDSYPHFRSVDGVDPNRNFPSRRDPDKKSVKPVAELRKFCNQIKPDGVLSGHTYGRLFLYPFGDTTKKTEQHDDYVRICKKMSELSGYTFKRACHMYNRPIFGTEVDWYQRSGSFAMIIEYGTHQRIPSYAQIKGEFKKTYPAVLYFIEELPRL